MRLKYILSVIIICSLTISCQQRNFNNPVDQEVEVDKIVLNTPANDSVISDSTPTLIWNEDSHVSDFSLQVDRNNTFHNPIIDISNIHSNNYTVNTELEDNTYHWRICARYGEDRWGDWSNSWNFTIWKSYIGNLKVYYPFNGNINDESGNGFDGLSVHNAFPATDRFNNSESAYEFVENGYYIELPRDEEIINQVQTISFWVYFNTDLIYSNGNVNQDVILKKAHDTGYQRDGFARINNNKISNLFGTSASSTSELITNTVFVKEKWYHVVFVRTSTTNSVYVNGILDNSGTYSGYYIKDDDYLRLGTYYDSSNLVNGLNRNMKGRVDDVRIYNRALTDNEVITLYHENGWDE